MNNIGVVINELRCNLGMSRKELAKDICTEKYVYLIEKGKRAPSSDMTNAFSARLGENLFEYYQYFGCINPVAVCKMVKRFNLYRRTGKYHEIQKITEEALNIPDFHLEPWVYEIEVNRICYMVFAKQNYLGAIDEIKAVLKEIKLKHYEGESVTNLYVLLSTCYQATQRIEEAKCIVELAYESIRNKKNDNRYLQSTISVYLNKMTLYYYSCEYKKVIQTGLKLLQIQMEEDVYERAHYTYFYLAYAYYKDGSQEEAILWFKKGLYLILMHEKSIDVFYIVSFDIFYELLYDNRLNAELVDELKRKYSIYIK